MSVLDARVRFGPPSPSPLSAQNLSIRAFSSSARFFTILYLRQPEGVRCALQHTRRVESCVHDCLQRSVGSDLVKWVCFMHHDLARWACVVGCEMLDNAALAKSVKALRNGVCTDKIPAIDAVSDPVPIDPFDPIRHGNCERSRAQIRSRAYPAHNSHTIYGLTILSSNSICSCGWSKDETELERWCANWTSVLPQSVSGHEAGISNSRFVRSFSPLLLHLLPGLAVWRADSQWMYR